MNNLKKYIFVVTGCLIILLIGFASGLAVNDIPLFSWKRELSFADLADLMLTIIVAFLIPLSLSPLLTNKRTIKDFLIGETKDCIAFLYTIKDRVDKISLEGKTEKFDRLKVNTMISRDLGMRISSLTEQLELSFEKESKDLVKEINKSYSKYWQEMTSGELMSDSFQFNIGFCVLHDKNFKKVEKCLKKTVHKINNF